MDNSFPQRKEEDARLTATVPRSQYVKKKRWIMELHGPALTKCTTNPLALRDFITTSGSPFTPVRTISGAPYTGPPTTFRGFSEADGVSCLGAADVAGVDVAGAVLAPVLGAAPGLAAGRGG